MENLIAAQRKWERQNGLEKTIQDVQEMIDLLAQAKDGIAAESSEPALVLTKLKGSIKGSFDSLNADAKALHTSITNYGKALDKKFKPVRLPISSLVDEHLINRAIGMHLLREGLFDVASAFVQEVTQDIPDLTDEERAKFWTVKGIRKIGGYDYDDSDDEMVMDDEHGDLQSEFADMYNILHALRSERVLEPAIEWAKLNSDALEVRGSNLEFELCRLRFIELYLGGTPEDIISGRGGPLRALEYARQTFPSFSRRYFHDIASLMGSLAYSPAIHTSPYRALFYDMDAWETVATSFTKEFCGLLGLSEKSPLYTAVTAGGIALPVLEKLERVMSDSGGQWTSANELPVEIPLPREYLFHSIFVCPVSKEQATDTNPPMMMPCGHVIAKESMEKISRGTKYKCPYCPNESFPRDAKRVYL